MAGRTAAMSRWRVANVHVWQIMPATSCKTATQYSPQQKKKAIARWLFSLSFTSGQLQDPHANPPGNRRDKCRCRDREDPCPDDIAGHAPAHRRHLVRCANADD